MAKHFRDLEVLELCGQGGMGVVYKARHTRLDRVVALKVLHQDASRDPAFAERFLREARALARLSHPGIVAVHDFGEVDGLYYLVMEFVDGVDLRRTIRGGELAPRQALTIVRELCEALQYAHDEGIVHRDIKPENVLIDKRGRVKIADFGLAKLAGSMLGGGALTATGQVMGTPHYMAPEQIEHPQDVDHRADIYSLGVVLYEMLTGSLPLGRFEAPSRRVDIDVRLDEIVLRTLEREPARRYQHAVDVKTDVDVVGQGDAKPAAAAGAEPVDGLRYFVKDESKDRVIAAGVVGSVDPSSGMWPIVMFAGMWLLSGWLFNFGAWGLVAAALCLVGLSHGVLTGRARRIRSLWTSLEKEGRGTKAARAIGAFAFLALGFASLIAAHIAAWERGTESYQPPPGALYIATHDEPKWSELQELLYPGSGSTTRLEDARFEFLDRGRLLFQLNPFAFGAIAATCWLVSGLCLTLRRSSRSSFRPAIEAVASALIGLGFVHLVLAITSGTGPAPQGGRQNWSRGFAGSADEIYERARAGLLEGGFQVHAAWHGRLVLTKPENEEVPAIVFAAHETSPLKRWRLGWRGPERVSPQLYFILYGDPRHGRGNLEITGGWYPSGSRLASDCDRRVNGLFRRLND